MTIENQARFDNVAFSVRDLNPAFFLGGRQDAAFAAEHETTKFLRVNAHVSRIGVMEYKTPFSANPRFELKLPEELFSKEALKTYKDLPVTKEHPPYVIVQERNWRKDMLGISSGPAHESQGYYLDAELCIFDPALKAQIMARALKGDPQNVSCGYLADLDETPGEWNGIHYDAIQRNIRFNHVAVVEQGRGGESVSIDFDKPVKNSAEGPVITAA